MKIALIRTQIGLDVQMNLSPKQSLKMYVAPMASLGVENIGIALNRS